MVISFSFQIEGDHNVELSTSFTHNTDHNRIGNILFIWKNNVYCHWIGEQRITFFILFGPFDSMNVRFAHKHRYFLGLGYWIITD